MKLMVCWFTKRAGWKSVESSWDIWSPPTIPKRKKIRQIRPPSVFFFTLVFLAFHILVLLERRCKVTIRVGYSYQPNVDEIVGCTVVVPLSGYLLPACLISLLV
jgi:hypothetical protein